MRKKEPLIIIFIFLLSSCNYSKQEKTEMGEYVNELNVRKVSEIINDESNLKEEDCNEFSEVMKSLIQLLKIDNYAINQREEQSELLFKSYNEELNRIDETITFPKGNFKSIYVKRKNKLKNKTDNWYPSFTVTEICFNDTIMASKSYYEISEIIHNHDLLNEKNYDYILKNGSRLIYVSCGAKIFEGYAFSYKPKIEELLSK